MSLIQAAHYSLNRAYSLFFVSSDIDAYFIPLSNMVLGYTKDLRTHPMSVMLSKGVQCSINSDDPGLFGYEGVALDWVYAVGCW